jgi:hypothetical protein
MGDPQSFAERRESAGRPDHQGVVAHVHTLPFEPVMHTHPSAFPASLVVVQTSLPVPVVQAVVHGSLSAVDMSHAVGVALSW